MFGITCGFHDHLTTHTLPLPYFSTLIGYFLASGSVYHRGRISRCCTEPQVAEYSTSIPRGTPAVAVDNTPKPTLLNIHPKRIRLPEQEYTTEGWDQPRCRDGRNSAGSQTAAGCLLKGRRESEGRQRRVYLAIRFE